jgi:hypothetical protein
MEAQASPQMGTKRPLSRNYPLRYIRDEWEPSGTWKRGSRTVTRDERNYMYLVDVGRWWARIADLYPHSDFAAEEYARRAAHCALLYLRGAR